MSGRSADYGYGTGSAADYSGSSGSRPKVVLGEKPFALQHKDEKKQFEVKNQAGLDYGVGDRVTHIKFGEGTVIAIDEGGRDYEVTVDFEDFGIKKMFAAFARLEKV